MKPSATIPPARPSQAAKPSGLSSVEGLLEVGDDVGVILTAYGEAKEARRDPRLRELLRRVLPVARRGRMVDDGVDAAEAGRARTELERVHETRARLPPALDLEGDHPAEAVQLAPGELVLRIALQAGVEDAGHLVVPLQEGGRGE